MAKQGSLPMTTPPAKSLSLPTTDSQLYTSSGVSSVFWKGTNRSVNKHIYMKFYA